MISCSTPQFLDHRPELAEHIRTCSPRARVVFDETHRFNPEVRRDWLRVRVDMVGLPALLWLRTRAGGVFEWRLTPIIDGLGSLAQIYSERAFET